MAVVDKCSLKMKGALMPVRLLPLPRVSEHSLLGWTVEGTHSSLSLLSASSEHHQWAVAECWHSRVKSSLSQSTFTAHSQLCVRLD